uniref:Zinc finger protein 280D n=1 Tax=Gasterosteus aculeatus aculeatus TaxID=481459 RepID=A0AAQ4QV76_GASAC
MSELFMECVEEELEPWQKQVPEVQLIDDDDDDDEPIFVGVLCMTLLAFKDKTRQGVLYVLTANKDGKPNPPAPPQRSIAVKQEKNLLAPKSAVGPQPVMLPLSVTAKAVNTAASNLTTGTPQPVIVNNQGFIVTSPQLANNSEFIASLGSHYPPGTSFTIVPAGQQHLFQQVTSAAVMPRAVHRPQVQQISNNVVTLSNVQSPAVYSAQSHLKIHLNPSIPQSLSTNNNNGTQKVTVSVENGILKKKCLKCQEEFLTQEALKFHTVSCCAVVESTARSSVNTGANKRIMLVSEFYYGRFEGDGNKNNLQKPNTTFKCQSCLKVLKNNIRFMNHMKHHLELEKQNSESWESHTTCQHCYRQYMTPFQLQCHIESAHSPIESSTNCKICELAFESEQVLLEHMKDNHKPGEMPYVCQVCNYRSSFFSEVETHFRSVHDNTKELLCPFCLKVLRSGHIYMQHYMKHQKKGIHRCGKCRLNFLTYKERVEHRTHYHKTFRKPKALDGLPPGTKVTIRASLTAKTPALQTSPDRFGIIVGTEAASSNQQTKPTVGASKAKANISAAGKAKMTPRGSYTCVECNTPVNDFFSHFPMFSNCGACKYRTSCKVSIGNHMIRFHSTITKNRFLKMNHKKNSSALKFTLVCLNCDLLVDGSGGDLMTKHLTDRPNHICKVIQEKVSYFLTTAPVHRPKEKNFKQEEGVSTGSILVDQDDQPEARQMLPEAEQDGSATETAAIEGSSESCSKQSLLAAGSPSCTSALGATDGSVGFAGSLNVREQVPPHETGEQQTKSK